jgi:hypothetical protein
MLPSVFKGTELDVTVYNSGDFTQKSYLPASLENPEDGGYTGGLGNRGY